MASFIGIAPLMRQRQLKTALSQILFLIAYVILILGLFKNLIWLMYLGLILYFMAFNYLEVMQPSEIAKKSPKHLKGSVMGVYYMLQSLGMFAGALIAGIAEKQIHAYLDVQNFLSASYSQRLDSFILFFALSAFFVLIWMLIDRLNLKHISIKESS
jgi:predicted MFS family arabinose efflux permease